MNPLKQSREKQFNAPAMDRALLSRTFGNSNVLFERLHSGLRLILTCALVSCALQIPGIAFAHGFNANHVDIVKTFGRKYRVIIRYTHVELGEYREAHIDFDKKDDAIKAFQDLVRGADFFLGDVKKSIHFHNPSEGNSPY